MNFELAKRTLRHPLSKAQVDVLRKLRDVGPCKTSKATVGVYVAGTAAAALARRGLVKAQGITWNGHDIEGSAEYVITHTGRTALRLIEEGAAKP